MTFFGRRARLYVAFRVMHTSTYSTAIPRVCIVYLHFVWGRKLRRAIRRLVYLFISLYFMSRTITYGITTLHIRVLRVFTRNATLPGVKPYPPPSVMLPGPAGYFD